MRDIGWIATEDLDQRLGPGLGGRRARGDDQPALVLDRLPASSSSSRHFATVGTHTVEIRSLGGGRVYLDAFVVLR